MSAISASLLKSVCEFEESLCSSSQRPVAPVAPTIVAKNQTVSYVGEDLIPRWSNAEKSALMHTVELFVEENKTDEINWGLVSARIPDRQPIECLMKYRNELDPSINRAAWSRDEEMKLVDLVQKYRCRFWVLVAEELGTGRTPRDCLQHYQQSFGTMVICNNELWSKEEDETLLKAVVAYGEKNWQHVANSLSGRTRQQCLLRYRRIAKSDKDGFWSDEEERRLFLTVISHFRSSLMQGRVNSRVVESAAVAPAPVPADAPAPAPAPAPETEPESAPSEPAPSLSAPSEPAPSSSLDQPASSVSTPNINSLVVSWMKISRQIPGRQDSQCREKWSRALDPMLDSSKASAEEDVKIMELVAKHGVGNWSIISQELPGRNDKFVFKRWKLLSAQGDIEAFHAISRSKRMTHFQHGRKKAKTELQPADYEASVLDPRASKSSVGIGGIFGTSIAASSSVPDTVNNNTNAEYEDNDAVDDDDVDFQEVAFL